MIILRNNEDLFFEGGGEFLDQREFGRADFERFKDNPEMLKKYKAARSRLAKEIFKQRGDLEYMEGIGKNHWAGDTAVDRIKSQRKHLLGNLHSGAEYIKGNFDPDLAKKDAMSMNKHGISTKEVQNLRRRNKAGVPDIKPLFSKDGKVDTNEFLKRKSNLSTKSQIKLDLSRLLRESDGGNKKEILRKYIQENEGYTRVKGDPYFNELKERLSKADRRAAHRERISGSNRRFRPTPVPVIEQPKPQQPPKPVNVGPTTPPPSSTPSVGNSSNTGRPSTSPTNTTPPKGGNNVPPKGGGTPKPTTPPSTGGGGGKTAGPGFLKRNRKALMIGASIAGLGGLGYVGYKKYKDSKKVNLIDL